MNTGPATTLRPGLPMPAARNAAQRGETLVYSEALLDAREATPQVNEETLNALRTLPTPPTASETLALIAEIDRLRAVERDRVVLLERLAHEEAQRYDMGLKYMLRRIDNGCYIPWSGGSDGPATYGTLTRAQALERGWLDVHLDLADARAGEDGDRVPYNRAGPGEKCLTREALREAYASRDAYGAFRLTPDKVAPLRTSGREDPVTGEWDDETVYWTPWAPDEVPDALPEGWPDRY